MRTSKEWMREDTSQFLKWKSYLSTGAKAVLARFGARPVSGGPNQPVDAADVRRRAVLWGASNEFAVCTAACVGLRWSAAGGARFASQAQQTRSRSDQFERARGAERMRCRPLQIVLLSLYLPIQVSTFDWRSSRLPPTERKVSNGGSSPQRR